MFKFIDDSEDEIEKNFKEFTLNKKVKKTEEKKPEEQKIEEEEKKESNKDEVIITEENPE